MKKHTPPTEILELFKKSGTIAQGRKLVVDWMKKEMETAGPNDLFYVPKGKHPTDPVELEEFELIDRARH